MKWTSYESTNYNSTRPHCRGFKWSWFSSVQFSSVAQSCLTLCDPMNCSTPGLPVHHQLLEFTQTHVHRVSDAIQPSHPLLPPFPPAPNPSQHQSLFQWVNSSHEVAKGLDNDNWRNTGLILSELLIFQDKSEIQIFISAPFMFNCRKLIKINVSQTILDNASVIQR